MADEVYVYSVDLNPSPEAVEAMRACLTVEDLERAARFVFDIHRRRFTVAHGALRTILGRHLGVGPREIEFFCGPRGKPYIVRTPLQFNLSHSEELALLAVTERREVGIDVEHVRPIEHMEGIVDRFFAPAETSALMALPVERRQDAFYRLWSRKEAYIKALGQGIYLGLDTFEVSHGEEAHLLATRPDGEERTRWSMQALDVGPSYRAALVVKDLDPFLVRRHTFE